MKDVVLISTSVETVHTSIADSCSTITLLHRTTEIGYENSSLWLITWIRVNDPSAGSPTER